MIETICRLKMIIVYVYQQLIQTLFVMPGIKLLSLFENLDKNYRMR